MRLLAVLRVRRESLQLLRRLEVRPSRESLVIGVSFSAEALAAMALATMAWTNLAVGYGAAIALASGFAAQASAQGAPAAEGWTDHALTWLRQGVTISALGLNLSTVLLQPVGATQAMQFIGPKWFGVGLAQWLGTPAHMLRTAQQISELSPMMRNRADTFHAGISEATDLLRPRSRAERVITAASFYPIAAAQKAVASILPSRPKSITPNRKCDSPSAMERTRSNWSATSRMVAAPLRGLPLNRSVVDKKAL